MNTKDVTLAEDIQAKQMQYTVAMNFDFLEKIEYQMRDDAGVYFTAYDTETEDEVEVKVSVSEWSEDWGVFERPVDCEDWELLDYV